MPDLGSHGYMKQLLAADEGKIITPPAYISS